MAIYSLYIINKAGGLIYQNDFINGDGKNGQGPPKLSSNEYLVLAGTFHGIHAITSKISPIDGKSSGIEAMETDSFHLYCFQTMTGIKFVLISEPNQPAPNLVEQVLRKIYEIYADYVMKNPFYTPEMPIRSKLFDDCLNKLCKP